MKKFRSFLSRKSDKQLLENFLSLFLLQSVSYLLPLITLPYLVRVIGIEKFGLVAFAQAFALYFFIFIDFGFNLSATREISIHRDSEEKITEIFSSIMIIKLFLSVVSFLIISIIVFTFKRFSSDWKIYYLSFLWVIGQTIFPVWYFQGLEKMKFITLVNMISKSIFTVLIFFFVKSPADYYFVPLLNGTGALIGGVISLWIIFTSFHQKFKLCSFKTLKYYFIESSQFFLSRVSVSAYTSSNAFILGLFVNVQMVGYYSVAEKLYQALQQVYQPIVVALYPYISKQKNVTFFKKIFIAIVFLNGVTLISLYFFGQNIFNLLFTSAIGPESLKVFHILLLAAFIVVPSILMGYPFLAALGFAKYANMSVIIGSIFHLTGLTILVLTGVISIYSVAYMVIATELLVFVSRIYWSRRNLLW